MIADALSKRGWNTAVVCASNDEKTIDMGTWRMRAIPARSQDYRNGFLSDWLPNPRLRMQAERILDNEEPDIVYMGAWNSLLEFGKAAAGRGIPVIQMVHDLSIFCVMMWQIDSTGANCSGPDDGPKCIRCVHASRGIKQKTANALLSIPILGNTLQTILPANSRYNIHVPSRVQTALNNMQAYREQVTRFILQAPHLLPLFASHGVPESKCRLLYQFIGNEKRMQYPRTDGRTQSGRPVRFIYIGRWTEAKGAVVLEKAFKQASVRHPAELWVASNDLPDEVVSRSGTSWFGDGKSFQTFTGLHGAELSKRIAQADVCIVPSVGVEIASRIVFEANAQRVPVIATTSVGNKFNIIDGKNGRIIPAGDIAALQNCIETISEDPSIAASWIEEIIPPPTEAEWEQQVFAIFDEMNR